MADRAGRRRPRRRQPSGLGGGPGRRGGRPLVTGRRVLRDGILLYLVIVVLRLGLIDVSAVPSGSMRPTLEAGDVVLVDRRAYGPSPAIPGLGAARAARLAWAEPARGDVVVFAHPEQPGVVMVKRVIGRPGDSVAADAGGRVALDGTVLPLQPFDGGALLWRQCLPDGPCPVIRARRGDGGGETPADGVAAPAAEPVVVAPGHFYVLGDDRTGSSDSRDGWQVPAGAVLGRVVAVLWSHDPAPARGPRDWLAQWEPARTLRHVE